MPLKVIKLPFRSTFFPPYRDFFSKVFNNYTPGTVQTVRAPNSSLFIEKISYAVPKEEYELFRECVPQKESVTTMPAATQWIEIEFVGSDEYDASYSNLYFHDKAIGKFDIYAHPHLFSPHEGSEIAASLQSLADAQYGKEVYTIININESFRGKRLWVYSAVTKCTAVIASIISAIRREIHGKETIDGFTKAILAETHILVCNQKPCVEFRKDWGNILTNEAQPSWDILYSENEKIFHKWKIYKNPPR